MNNPSQKQLNRIVERLVEACNLARRRDRLDDDLLHPARRDLLARRPGGAQAVPRRRAVPPRLRHHACRADVRVPEVAYVV